MNKTITFTSELYQYLLEHNIDEHPVQRELREHTATLEAASLQIAAEQGAFLRLLVTLLRARRTLEVGVFTGYSALTVALALPDDGQIIACDINEEWTSVAAEFWRRAGVDGKIDLRLAPALETLDRLIADGASGSFDFAFIDADKGNYINYYERCLTLLRPGGLIAVDNTLWAGKLVDPSLNDPDTETIRMLNREVHEDPRVVSALVNVGDGMLLAVKL
jgi:predicted O-methyltransferase YrrM